MLLWLAVIATESFRMSSNVTGKWLWWLLHELHIQMSFQQFAKLHHILRKAGHFTGYGILCLLAFRAWFHTLDSGSRLRCAALAIAVTLVTAILDEWHQAFDPTRTSSGWDVVIDVTGGIVFLLFALFALRLWRAQQADRLQQISA